MSLQLNKVIIAGNLGRDPEIRTMNSGDPVANLSVATNKSWKDKESGEKKTRTEWHRVVVFGGLAKVIEKHCKSGSGVYIEGELQTRKWQDQSGQDKYTTEIVLNNMNGVFRFTDDAGKNGSSSSSSSNQQEEAPDLDDDIPF